MVARKEVASWILAVIAGLALLGAGALKLIQPAMMQEMLGPLGVPNWAIPVIGVYEVVFAIALIVPKTRVIGALFLVADMAVAALVHLINADWAGVVPTLVLGALTGAVLYLHRAELSQHVSAVRAKFSR